MVCLGYNNMKLGLLFVISLTVLAATASTGAELPRGLSVCSSPTRLRRLKAPGRLPKGRPASNPEIFFGIATTAPSSWLCHPATS